MDPFTIAFIASQGLKIANTLSGNELAVNQARLRRQIAELNAMSAEYDAFESVKIGLGKKASYENQVSNVVKKQNVIMAYNDVDSSFGTAKMIQEETKLIGRLNAMDIENAAYAQSLGYKRQALNYRLGGQIGEMQANAKASDALRASILSAGANTLLQWDKLNFGGEDTDHKIEDSYGLNYTGPQNEFTV